MKIEGFNSKEQKCYDILCDGEMHTIAEMKKKFVSISKAHCEEIYEEGTWDETTVDTHAQSFVRNSIRRLVRDGWAEKVGYGTYQFTKDGKEWVKMGMDETPGCIKKPQKLEEKTPKKIKKTPTKKAEKSTKVSKPKTEAKAETSKLRTKSVSKANGKALTKAKVKEAMKRVARQAAVEKAQQSIAEDTAA